MSIEKGAELDYFVLSFQRDNDRWMAAWRFRQQGAHIEVRNVGSESQELQLHVWLPKGRSPRHRVQAALSRYRTGRNVPSNRCTNKSGAVEQDWSAPTCVLPVAAQNGTPE